MYALLRGKINRKLFTVLMYFIIVSLTSCGKNKEALSEEAQNKAFETFLESYTKEGQSRCIIRLMPERSSYYIDEDGTDTISVMIPNDRMIELGISAESFQEKIDIIDSTGKVCAEIPSESLSIDGQGNVFGKASIVVNTKESGAYSFYAKTGDYTSAQAMIYVTPHISEKQVNEALELGEDLTAFLKDKYTEDDSDDTLVKAATKFLKHDERVDQVLTDETSVTFTTTAGIINVFNVKAHDPELLSEGSDVSEVEFETETQTTELYNQYGDGASVQTGDGPIRLDSGNTASNGNVLILRPATNAMNDIQIGQLKSAAKKINKITDSSIVAEYKNDDAVRAIMSGELVKYGTVILQTHGAKLSKQENGVSTTCGVSFLMYRNKTFRENTIANDLEAKLRSYSRMEYEISNKTSSQEQLDDFYRQFYGKIGEADTWRMYFLYARDWEDSVGLRFVGDIAMTSGYLMERYAESSFDNTVFYIGACEGACFPGFNEWLLNHGCQVVLGYTNAVNVNMSLLDFNDLFDQLTANNSQVEWRTQNLSEANENNENRFVNVVENIAQESLRKISELINNSTGMLLMGNDDFFYRGDGTLSGHVYYLYNLDEGRTEEKPCEGASLTPHLFKNQVFEGQDGITTASDGSFSFKELRCGVYAIEVKNDLRQENIVSIVFDRESLDGGKIYLPGPSLKGKVVEKQTGKPIEGAKVELTGKRDGVKHEVVTDAEGIWDWVYATQSYDIVVSYNDYSNVEYSDVIPNTNHDTIITEMDSFNWYRYIRDELAPKYGFADTEPKHFETDLTQRRPESIQYWNRRSGIVSADIADFTNDGTEDLILYRFVDQSDSMNQYHITAELYTRDGNKVNYRGNQDIGFFQIPGERVYGVGGDRNFLRFRIGVVKYNETLCILTEANYNFYSLNFHDISSGKFYTNLTGWDGKKFCRLVEVGKICGGTNSISYGISTYKNENLVSKQALWYDGDFWDSYKRFPDHYSNVIATQSGNCTSAFESVKEGYRRLGLPEMGESYYEYSDWDFGRGMGIVPSYWNTDTMKKTLEFGMGGPGDEDHRSLTDEVHDYTGLMDKIEN